MTWFFAISTKWSSIPSPKAEERQGKPAEDVVREWRAMVATSFGEAEDVG